MVEVKSEIESTSASPKDVLAKQFQRLVSRSLIMRQLNQNVPLHEIKSFVRDNLEKYNPDSLISHIIRGSFEYNEKVDNVMRGLKERIANSHKGVRALVLFGSLANYGEAARGLVGGVKKADLDWGLLYDPHIILMDDKLAGKIIKESTPFLTENGLSSCISLNPVSEHEPLLTNHVEAMEVLEKFAVEDESIHHRLMIHFMPSYPSFIQEDNINLIFKALKQLAINNYDKWEVVVDNISKAWSKERYLLEKHLDYEQQSPPKSNYAHDNDRRLRSGISKISEKVLYTTMLEILYISAYGPNQNIVPINSELSRVV